MAKTTRPQAPAKETAKDDAAKPTVASQPAATPEPKPVPDAVSAPDPMPAKTPDPDPVSLPDPTAASKADQPRSAEPAAKDAPIKSPFAKDFAAPSPAKAAAVNTPPTLEPKRDTPAPAPTAAPEAKRGSGFVGLVVGGILAAALGYGVATYAPIAGLSDQKTKTDEIQSTLAALTQRLAALEDAPAPTPDTGLADRVAALEQAPNQPQTDPAAPDLSEPVAEIDARLTALENAILSQGASAEPAPDFTADIAALRAEIAAIKGSGQSVSAEIAAAAADANARLAEAEAQAAALKAQAEETARKSLARAAISRLQGVLESGAPFASALDGLSGFDIPASLVKVADAGVPTLAHLQEVFPPAARTALEASLRADMGASWIERAGSFLQSTTGARSLSPREGNDPDAILSRAEAALKKGDLDLTLTEISALPAPGQAAMAGFTEMATQRRQAIQDITALSNAIEE